MPGCKIVDVNYANFLSRQVLDEQAFEAIFYEHYPKIHGVLFRLTGDPDEADDLTAETFWRLWERPPRQNENIAGWLYRVATRLAYNRIRDSRRRAHYEQQMNSSDPDAAASPDPSHQVEANQERRRVREVLRQMAMKDVQVLVLRHSGLSYKEIASALAIPINSVGKTLARAEERFEAIYRRGESNAFEG
ncbi:MAG: sigma-70 family RNA polymerase sigma factor [Chloroflexi bacterium]|nr:sigma-70 family RNA polymerase sigma factor [Chloroflexota bacterium]